MTTDYRLCNIVLNDGARSDEYPELYVRKSEPVFNEGDGSLVLCGAACVRHDFATYFNAFSNAKWRKYTRIDNVHLRICAQGTFEVRLVAYEQTLARPKRVLLASESYDFEDFDWVDLAYPEGNDALFLTFEIISYGKLSMREAYYYTRIDKALIRPVELAVATTTFKKEDYVIPNIELFRNGVLGSDEPIADHFTLHVVDNGRTLDVSAIEGPHIHVHPNPNTGGAGGFTRGMIEAMEQDPKATHVLLMDDDVQISPESLKRTYNLLTLVKDEYRDAFVSGAMLSFEQQDEFHEDTGWVRPDGTYTAYKERGEDEDRYVITTLEGITHVETDSPHHENRYAGWWYCCIPMSCIERSGLPLPLFIRGDDAEYGNRAARGFITMNGICLWHMTFFDKFSASLDRYQFQRNSLIAQATTGMYPHVDFLINFHYVVLLDLKTFNYDGAEMSLQAMEDFLKGPEFLKHVKGEDLIREHGKYNEQLRPIDELEREEPAIATASFNPNDPYDTGERNLATKMLDFVTYNGQRGPSQLARGGLGVMPYNGWFYPPNDIRGKDMLLAVSRDGNTGVLRRKDRARFDSLYRRYKELRKEFDKRHDEIYAEWAAAREELTSVEFWKWYLEDQAR